LSLKLGKYGAFIGCSNYPACNYTRVLSPNGEAEAPGNRELGIDPETGENVTLRNGRFGEYVQLGEGEKPKRASLPKGLSAADLSLEKALKLLSMPLEVARHPDTKEPILAGVGQYGPYVKHGKTYASLGKDDDVLEIGANRAIDLIVAKESGASSRFGSTPGRVLGDHPDGGAVSIKAGRFGAYISHGKVNATLPKGTNPDEVTLEQALEALKSKAAGVVPGGRLIGDHPVGGAINVLAGRYGAYVKWGKVNATIPKSLSPDTITVQDAVELIAEREGRPAKAPPKKAAAKTAPKKAAAKSAAKPAAKAKAAPKKASAKR
jgi:DNA topoisomerase-1